MDEPIQTDPIEQILGTEGSENIDTSGGQTFFTTETYVRILLALVSFTAFVLLRNIIASALTKPIGVVTKRVLPEHHSNFEDAFKGPISFICIAGGIYIAGNILLIPEEFQFLLVQIMHSILNLMVFWVLYKSVEPVSEVIQKTGTGNFNDEMRQVVVDLIKLGVVCVGLLALLQAWGINVGSFLAGLGLVGMAVALAAQDTLKNLFASLAMFHDKSFKKGDWILTPEVEGIVETVSLRTTTIRNFDTSVVVIPNSNLANATITNFNHCTHRRIVWNLPLVAPNEEKFKSVVERLEKYVRAHPKVDQKASIIVKLDEFGEACIKLFVYFMVNETAWLPFMEIKQQILIDFLRIVDGEGCNFGVPTRAIRVHKV